MVDVAIEAAKGAGKIALEYFQSDLSVSYKADNSPVTQADKEAESFIRDLISKKFRDHGIHGEEFGDTHVDKKYVWVIDPIDGTKDYLRQLPYWCTLLALLKDGRPIIAVAYFPPYDELFVAEKAKGATCSGNKVKISETKELRLAYITHTSPSHFADHGKTEELVKLCQTVQSPRNFSGDNLRLLFKGEIDAYIAGKGDIHDFAAPALLVEEAGGKFSDFDGQWKLDSNSALLTNGHLHQQILDILQA